MTYFFFLFGDYMKLPTITVHHWEIKAHISWITINYYHKDAQYLKHIPGLTSLKRVLGTKKRVPISQTYNGCYSIQGV